MMLSRRVALRAVEANWMITHLPNGAGDLQKSLLLGAGVVYWIR